MTAFISDRPIRIGIVDDNDLHREILHKSLNLLPNLTVVAEAKNGAEAVEMVKFLHPDIVLMDVSMPVLNGIEATRIISSNFSDTKVIILTVYCEVTNRAAELVDRNGKTMALPVTVTERPDPADGLTWVVAELALAPLAEGEYAVRLHGDAAGGPFETVMAFRLVAQ